MSSYSKERTLRDAEASIPLNVGDSEGLGQAELLADGRILGNAQSIGRGEGHVEWRDYRGQVGHTVCASPMTEPDH